MVKFEELLEKFQAGDKTAKKQMIDLFGYLKDREILILRENYGIGCNPRPAEEIADKLGLEIDELKYIYKRTLSKIEYIFDNYPELFSNDKICSDQNNQNLNILLKNFPAFIKLKQIKSFSGPLARYAKYTLAQFILEYNHHGLKGKEVYDKLMSELAPDMIGEDSEKPTQNPLNTVFPSSFNEKAPLGESYNQMVSELFLYLKETSIIPKNKKRADIVDLLFHKNKPIQEIKDKLGISLGTIKDNFINPLFNEGVVDEISLNPLFKESIDNYISSIIYSPLQKVRDDVQLDGEDLQCFLSLFGVEVYESSKYHQSPIIIHKGDLLRANECIYRVFDTLSDAIVPISKQQLFSKLEAIIDPDKWLPEYIDFILSTNEAILQNNEGLLYLSSNMLKTITHRVCRIIYNSPNYTATKKDIMAEYVRLYNEEPAAFRYKEMEEKHFYNISDGCYKYVPDQKKPISVHEYIDNYISSNILIKWSDLLSEIKKINSALNEDSERAYTTNKCNTCSSDSDILVLKGREQDYPQFKWNAKRKMDKTNFFINRAVELLKMQPNCEMTYKEFLSQLNAIIRKNGYSEHTTGSVISKYTNKDPKLFIKEGGNIRLDENILADVTLDYIGLGYKNADFYISIYAMAISELKSRPDHKMLRSEIVTLAKSQISDEIDGKIVNKAFADRAKPELLVVDGKGINTYICLDMLKLTTVVAEDKQYKVDVDDAANQTESTPKMVIDTTPRPDTSYRQVFNWNDIISMMRKDLKHYDKPFFYSGISSDEVIEKFHKFMSRSRNVYLNAIIPQAYYELSYANIDRWSSYDYRSKMARAFESLLMDIYYQNKGVESQTKGLREIMDLAFPDYLKARKTFDRTGFNGILNDIYNDRINFAHPTTSEMPTLLSNVKAFISYLALYVYTIAKYFKG